MKKLCRALFRVCGSAAAARYAAENRHLPLLQKTPAHAACCVHGAAASGDMGGPGCPFCEETALQTYYPSDDRIYRLYVCDSCRCYLKTIDLREIDRDVCLPVENIVTVSLDSAAREKGYRHY